MYEIMLLVLEQNYVSETCSSHHFISSCLLYLSCCCQNAGDPEHDFNQLRLFQKSLAGDNLLFVDHKGVYKKVNDDNLIYVNFMPKEQFSIDCPKEYEDFIAALDTWGVKGLSFRSKSVAVLEERVICGEVCVV